MSNKFWAGGSSSSDDSSDDDSDGSEAGGFQGNVRQAGRFALSDSSSGKRVILTYVGDCMYGMMFANN